MAKKKVTAPAVHDSDTEDDELLAPGVQDPNDTFDDEGDEDDLELPEDDPIPPPEPAKPAKPQKKLPAKPPAKAAKKPEGELQTAEEQDEFLKAVQQGASEEVVIPRATLEAEDWGESIGRAMKTAMEAEPNGVRVEILRVNRIQSGEAYALQMRVPGERARTATIQTIEWCRLYQGDRKRLGKWFRRIGNTLIGRSPEA